MSASKIDSPEIDTIEGFLDVLEFLVKKFIVLWQKEEEVPNPPDYEKTWERYTRAMLVSCLQDLNPAPRTEIPESDDELALEKAKELLVKVAEMISTPSGAEPTADKVPDPFKTESGQQAKEYCDRIEVLLSDFAEASPTMSGRQKIDVVGRIVDIHRQLKRAFPSAKLPPLGKSYRSGYRYVLVQRVHIILGRIAKIVSKKLQWWSIFLFFCLGRDISLLPYWIKRKFRRWRRRG